MLDQERTVFDEHLAEWLGSHRNQFVLIKGTEVVDFFPDDTSALEAGARQFGLTSFLVRQVIPQPVVASAPALMLGILRAHSSQPLLVPGSSA